MKWISCKERFPKNNKKVIAIDGFGNVYVADCENGLWEADGECSTYYITNIKYWCYLNPPKTLTNNK